MNTFIEILKYFCVITFELVVLFILTSAIVSLLLMYLPKNKIKNWMSMRGILGNFIGAIFGALTPFCACSTIPMTIGFLNMGIPFGVTMSFLIASPLMNPIILSILIALMGFKSALIYFLVTLMASVVFGIILEKVGGERLIKNIGTKFNKNFDMIIPKKFKDKIRISFLKSWSDFKRVIVYLLIGVGLGSIIYGYLPQEMVLKFAGQNNLITIPTAAIIGIPLYIRAETAIPIGMALMQKGMSVGAVIALIIGGAGMAIPEMSMLASIFKKKLVVAIVLVIFLTAVFGGIVFNLIL